MGDTGNATLQRAPPPLRDPSRGRCGGQPVSHRARTLLSRARTGFRPVRDRSIRSPAAASAKVEADVHRTRLRSGRGRSAPRTITDLTRLSGGASRETWRFVADGRPLILQRQRSGDGRDMGIEAGGAARRGAAGMPVANCGVGHRRRHPGGRLVHGDDGRRGRDHRPQDPARRRVRRGARALPAQLGAALAQLHAIPVDRAPGWSSRTRSPTTAACSTRSAEPHPTFELAFRWLEQHRPASPRTGDRARRLPARQRDRRRRRTARRARLGARPSRRPDGGPRLAVREGVALRVASRWPGSATTRELFDAYEAAGGGGRPGRGTVVGGARHAEVGDHVHHPVQRAHDRLLAQPRARCDRPSGLRERTRPVPGTGGTLVIPHDMPSGKELVESVREWLERDVLTGTTGRLQFHTRVAINVLAMVERELELGAAQAVAHRGSARRARMRRRRRARAAHPRRRARRRCSSGCASWCGPACATSSAWRTRSTWSADAFAAASAPASSARIATGWPAAS
jgi:hypothetical protein